ncbi:MAG: hypothetical protein IKV25_03980 [Clostridia bacterium]|nr:hypothetical protein [Clostridia bacterium]
MKIRGKFQKVNPIVPLYVLVGFLALAIPLRTYQLLFITESDTGFYKSVNWTVYALHLIAILAVAVSYVMVNLAKSVPSSKNPPSRKNKFLSVSSICFGFGIVLDAISIFSKLFLDKSGVALAERGNLVPLLIEGIFGVFAAIYILIFGISFFDGKTTYSQYKFLALTPLAWSVGRVIIRFLTRISYVNIADLLFELVAVSFMMIFFLALARISSGLANETSMRSLFASGFASAFFCLLTNVPRVIVTITGSGAIIPNAYPISVCDLFFAFFAVTYIINAMVYAKENDYKELQMENNKE